MKYILGVLGAILLVFVVFILFIRGDDTSTVQNANQPTRLVDYADKNSNVSITTIGRLVGDEERRAIRIVITPNERRLEILAGYSETVTGSETFPNTREAYSTFLSALSQQGFLTSRKFTADPRGACPTGNRYVYDLSQDGKHISNLWNTTCSNDTGTFAGKGTTIRQIFQRQIPAYNTLTKDIRL